LKARTSQKHIDTNMTLAQVPIGHTVKVDSLQFDNQLTKRCVALGLRYGASVTVIRRSPFNGPIHIRVGTTELAIRQAQAKLIKVL